MREARNELQRAHQMSIEPSSPSVRISFPKPPVLFAACNGGPCDGGRKVCPSPDACRLAEGQHWLLRIIAAIKRRFA